MKLLPIRRPLRFALALALCCAAVDSGRTQPPPLPPNPQAPTLKPAVPLGMQRGTTLDLVLTGTNLAEPTGLWTSFPAKVTIPTDNNNGKDNAKLLVRLEVPKDAPIGFYGLRLATRRGMSNLRLFCIDDLPQVQEENTNHARNTAQQVPVPCVVVGKADAEMSDYFKVSVQARQRVTFEVLGRRMGSAFDPQLTLYDSAGRELPGGHSNDAPGLQTDPRLTYTFKEAGDYVVEVRDVSYRGGDDFHYRLRIGDFPCATSPLPMAAKRGSKVSVRFAGTNVEGVEPVEVEVPADPTASAVSVAPKGANGLLGWPVTLAVTDLDEAMEQEPNDEPAQANRVAVPGAVTGRFEKKGDRDHYVFAAKKGQRVVIEAQTSELHSPTEVFMVISDAKGAKVQESNPMVAPRIDFTAAADGDYTLAVEHLHYWGGPSEAYHLTFTPYEPGFDLAVALDRFDVGQGGTVSIPILATRRDYTGPIEVSVVGKGLSGQATIETGKPAQPNQVAATLPVTAGADLEMGPYDFKVRGKATINGKEVVQYASVRAVLTREMANLAVPPRQLYTTFGLAVTEKPPFALAAKFDEASTTPGKPIGLTVTVTRAAGFTAEVALTAAGLPANVAPALKNIPADASEVKVQLNPAANSPVGQFPVTITGKAKHNNHDFTVAAQPVPLVLTKAVAPSNPTYPPPAEVRANFHTLLDRPAVPLDVKTQLTVVENGLAIEHLSFASEKRSDGTEERVPVLLVRPETVEKKLPAVIVLHGTGGRKEGQRPWLVELAKRGIIGVAIDARYHGERAGGAKGAAAYNEAITRAWKSKPGEPQEHPFYYDTCWDLWKTVDYLATRPDVNAGRIGMIGFSMGGIETWLAASVDERVKAIVPAIGVQSFRWSLENDRWQARANTIKAAHEAAARDLGEPAVNQKVCLALWRKVIPGIVDQFDCPSMLRLCAGRPLLILNGELDPNCPLEGAKLAFASAEAAYKEAKASDKLRIDVAKGVKHAVTEEQRKLALEWFEKWLKQ
jgi:dienelactone hydrolase